MSDIVIRGLTSYDECVQVRYVQRRCWGFAQKDMGLYPPLLLSVSENGGTVLGAFDGDQMVGYLFGYPALHDPDGRRILKIHSQTMGVLPEYRNRGLAEQLKWAQRDRALALGIELVTWTFDPLEGTNAHLNLHKLGGIARTYKRNVYGEHFGQLNEGQPTDRFLVEWWIARERLPWPGAQRAQGRQVALAWCPEGTGQASFTQSVSSCVTHVEGTRAQQRLVGYDLGRTDDSLTVEIPDSIQAIRRADLALAREWRLGTREIFETYFANGYVAVDLVGQPDGAGRHNCYVLARLASSGS